MVHSNWLWRIFTSSQNKIVTLWLKVQNAVFFFSFSSFTWTYVNLPLTELLKCENNANPHQHLYMAGMWRGPWQMCSSNSFLALCALYLSPESYYLPGWAGKHLKHDINNNFTISLPASKHIIFFFCQKSTFASNFTYEYYKDYYKGKTYRKWCFFCLCHSAFVDWIKETKVWTKTLVSSESRTLWTPNH